MDSRMIEPHERISRKELFVRKGSAYFVNALSKPKKLSVNQ
jgi:hypothetical protein